jgi:hypothetical protein
MATEKQIRANRENAKKSTGPRTAAGRAKSSRNALRHGLSLPLTFDAETSAKADRISQILTAEEDDEAKRMAALELTSAQLDLLLIRAIRGKAMEKINEAAGDLVSLRRFGALDRYEARALTRRRRASSKLAPD